MTKRTRAANARTLPANGPNRRTLLTSGAAAAFIASTAAALPAPDPDAELLALRPRWLAIQSAMDAINDPRSAADQATYDALKARMPRVAHATSMAERERLFDQRRDLTRQLPQGIAESEGERQAREDQLAALCSEEETLIRLLEAQPARTIAGLGFKAEVFLVNDGWADDLGMSLAIDAATIARLKASAATA